MRILTVGSRYPPWSTGGYEVVWSAAVRWLRSRGHAVRVLTTVPDPSDRPPSGVPPVDVHRELSWYWREHRFPAMSFRATAALERANALTLAHHLEELDPEAVIWWAMGGMSLSLVEQVRRAGLPALGLVGDDWMVYGPEVDAWTHRWQGRWRAAAALGERLLGIPTRPNLDAGARWLFNSQHLLSAAREAGRRPEDASIAPPGVDPGLFAPSEPGRWRWRLLYCGRVDPRKGIATAIHALAHLPPEATLSVHGEGETAVLEQLRALASAIGVADRVHFGHSDHERVPLAYAATDAVVFPVTWREPWGLVPLEAMAVGRPLVAARSGGGPAEYLEEGRNCLQFEPGDALGLADAVRALGADPALRGGLVAAGRATASRFTEQAFHQRIEDELTRLCARRG